MIHTPTNTLFAPVVLTIRHRHLLMALAGRDIRDRYAGSALGVAWSVLQPLVLIVVLLAVFGTATGGRAIGVGAVSGGASYAMTTLAAFLPWYYTSIVLGSAASVIRLNQSLVRQIEFPVEILPVKIVISAMLIECIMLALIIVYGLISGGLKFHMQLLMLPVALSIQILFLIGTAWIISVLGMYFRDIEQAIASLLFLNLYLLPIFFTRETAPIMLADIVAWNPFTPMVEVFRSVFMGTVAVQSLDWLTFLLISVAVFFLGWHMFRALKGGFGDLF